MKLSSNCVIYIKTYIKFHEIFNNLIYNFIFYIKSFKDLEQNGCFRGAHYQLISILLITILFFTFHG